MSSILSTVLPKLSQLWLSINATHIQYPEIRYFKALWTKSFLRTYLFISGQHTFWHYTVLLAVSKARSMYYVCANWHTDTKYIFGHSTLLIPWFLVIILQIIGSQIHRENQKIWRCPTFLLTHETRTLLLFLQSKLFILLFSNIVRCAIKHFIASLLERLHKLLLLEFTLAFFFIFCLLCPDSLRICRIV